MAAFCPEVTRVLRPDGRFVLIDSWVAEDEELDHFINHIEWGRDTTHGRSLRMSERRTLAEGARLAAAAAAATATATATATAAASVTTVATAYLHLDLGIRVTRLGVSRYACLALPQSP